MQIWNDTTAINHFQGIAAIRLGLDDKCEQFRRKYILKCALQKQ